MFHRLPSALGLFVAATLFAAPAAPTTPASPALVPFTGEKSAWRDGFERFDFVMDEATLAITPFKAPEGEKFGVRDPEKGKRRCVVVAPKTPAPGNPWSWQGCYWDHQPQTEVELLKRGFHIAYISANATLRPGKEWDAWYAFLTTKHGFSPKPTFIGMSRGGEYAYTWATANPDKVSAIYADNPGGNRELLSKFGPLASNNVPLLHVCGSIDPLLVRYSSAIENIYQQLGGRISVVIKDGVGHHPHSLRDPGLMADFLEQGFREKPNPPPAFLAGRTTRNTFYGTDNFYRNVPTEDLFVTLRGPWFSGSHDRFTFELPGVEGVITVIVPRVVATGNPWVLRSEMVSREAVTDLALLAKGFHIVTGPVPYNGDGPALTNWNKAYEHLVKHGLNAKPVLAGAGRSAGDAYAWAIANPDKVSCLYGENPVLLRSTMSKTPLLEGLPALAKAGVRILHVAGSLDPAYGPGTREVERRYKELGGKMSVIVKEGEGHYPLGPKNPMPVLEFITGKPL